MDGSLGGCVAGYVDTYMVGYVADACVSTKMDAWVGRWVSV